MKKYLRSVPGVQVLIDLPTISRDHQVFYRWDFEPMWIYDAPLASSAQPDKICWATNENYLSDYTLQLDNKVAMKRSCFLLRCL